MHYALNNIGIQYLQIIELKHINSKVAGRYAM